MLTYQARGAHVGARLGPRTSPTTVRCSTDAIVDGS